MTTFGDDSFIRCPHCKKPKKMITVNSGNTFGGTRWSDTKNDFPMMPRPSAIQECPWCGKFYFYSRPLFDEMVEFAKELMSPEEVQKLNKSSATFGWLKYEQVLVAAEQFKNEEISKKDEQRLYWMLVHGYNDEYQRGEKKPVSKEKFSRFKDDVLHLISLIEPSEQSPVIIAELYREIGEFSKCLETLESFEVKNKDDDRSGYIWEVVEMIKSHAAKGISHIFKL